MADTPQKAFVLAAGRGERMRPLTDSLPKPLLNVGGRTMLDRALDALHDVGVKDAIVNTHYLGDMIASHLQGRTVPRITLSPEEKLLETGGGVIRRLDFFGNAPFYVLNSDNICTDGPVPALQRLADAWDAERMDVLLLVQPVEKLHGKERGDYFMNGDFGQPVFFKNSEKPANCVFIGPRIVHPRLFDGETRENFSFLDLFHKAEAAGRLFVLKHDADWYHVGTPDAYHDTCKILAA
jgi:N-acetyl-alpha-D-muramate 1-phosphate uridylyltransferase